MSRLDLDNPAWLFATALYGAPGVPAECLRLQDEAGLDVSLLLVTLWLGAARGVVLVAEDLREADMAVAEWRDLTVKPLRAVRRAVKGSALIELGEVAEFRRRIAAVELGAEQIQIALLHGWAAERWPGDAPTDEGSEAALSNLRLVLTMHGAGLERVPTLAAAAAACRAGAERAARPTGRDRGSGR